MQTQEQTQQNIQSFIEELTENSIQHIEADGGCNPVMIFLYERPDGVFAQAVLDIGEAVNSEVGKEIIVKEVLPRIKEKITDDGNTIHALCFMTEAWAYEVEKDYVVDDNRNYRKNGKKTEKLMMSFHLKDKVVNFTYDIMRIGETMKITNKQVSQQSYDDKELVGKFSKLM